MDLRAVTRDALGGVGRADVAAAAVVVVIGLQEAARPIGPGWEERLGPPTALATATTVAGVALLWRRRAPLTVALVVFVALVTNYLIFGSSDGLALLLAPLFAFYAVGRYGDGGRLAIAAAITAAGIAVHEWRDPLFVFAGPAVVFWTVQLGAGVVGWVLNRRSRDLHQLSQRSAMLESEREERDRAAVIGERERIAQELHDLVGHGISLMVLQLMAAEADLDAGHIAQARSRLVRIESTARGTLGEMRRLVAVTDESPSRHPQPGVHDVAALVEETRASGVAVELSMTEPIDAPPGLGLAVYRLVQEALTNVIKHAGPAAAPLVRIAVAGDILTVEVDDQGQGPTTELGGGRGLAGMRERVGLYGGTLDVGRGPRGGFQICARFPLESATA